MMKPSKGRESMKKIFSLMASLLMVSTMVACSDTSNSASTLVVGATELDGTFSPIYYSSTYDGYVVDMVYESLLDYNYEEELEPKLAKELPIISDEGKTITFTLKEGIKFSDGSTLEAEDVAFTYTVMCDPSYTGRFQPNVQNLVGFKEYYEGNAERVSGIEVIDETTISFHFTQGYRTNQSDISLTGILNKESYAYTKGNTKGLEEAMQTPMGTGPYVLKSWEKATGAVFVKNENYWDEGYAISQVIIKPVEMTTDAQELEKKNIDMLLGMIEPSKIGSASKKEHIAYNSYLRAGEGYITINASDEAHATKEKEVRQALLYAFDRESFVNSYFKSEELGKTIAYVPTTMQNPVSIIGDVVSGEKEVEGLNTYEYNIEIAKSLLDSSGWIDHDGDGIRDKDNEKLTIKVIAMEDHDILNTLIPMWQKDWGENLGADVQVAMVDFNTLLAKIKSDADLSEWNIFFLATSYTGKDLDSIYASFHSSQAKEGADNYARLKDSELDRMLDEAKLIWEEEDVIKAYSEIAKRVNEDAVQMPVYGNTYFDMYNKEKIENFKTSALYDWVAALKEATLKE